MRCPASFDTREELQKHAEWLHGDYQQARTRAEYLKFRKDRGDDLTLVKQFLVSNFLSVRQLKAWMRAGKAVSDLYGVRKKGVRKYRK